MFRPMLVRRLFLASLLPLTVLLGSVGVDVYAIVQGRPAVTAASPGVAFPQPGPRRYPPGYRAGY